MTPVSRTHFNGLVPASWPRGDPNLHREEEWYVGERRLGIIVYDLVDHDYGFVLLNGDPVACVDVGTSFDTPERARAAMEQAAMRENAFLS